MKTIHLHLGLIALILTSMSGGAQSTTAWIAIGPSGTNVVTRNSAYASVTFLHCRLNAKANWWTKLIATQKTAVIIADTTADYGSQNGSYLDKRSSPTRDLKHYDKSIDIAWKQPLAVNLPTTFRALRVSVTVGTSAKDGAEALLKTANELSSKIPNPTPAQNAIGVISTVKSLIDLLVGNQLTKTQLACDSGLLTSESTPFPAGNYVVFAADTAAEYKKYLEKKDKLEWDGAQVSFDGNAIEDVSYFVINVDYIDRLLKVKNKDILSNTRSAWASLYTSGFELIDKLTDVNKDEIKKELQSTFASAHKVLNLDPDYVMTEKDEMHETLVQIAGVDIKKRLSEFAEKGVFSKDPEEQAADIIDTIK